MTIDWSIGASIVAVFAALIGLAVAYLRLYVGTVATDLGAKIDKVALSLGKEIEGCKTDIVEVKHDTQRLVDTTLTKELAGEKISSLHRRISTIEQWVSPRNKGVTVGNDS